MLVVRILAVLLCLRPVLSTVASAASEGKLLDLPVAATAAALDPESGNVVIASATENQVWLLPSAWFDNPSVAPIGPLAATTNPVSLLFKRYQDRTYLVVACFDGNGITVLDAATRKIVASIPPNPASPRVLVSASDDPQDPWIYVTSASGNRLCLDAFRIDSPKPVLGEITPRNQVSLSFKPTSGGFFVSSSGQSLYGIDKDRRTITKWSVQSPATAAEVPTTKYVAHALAMASAEPLIRLPREQGIAQGSSYRLADLSSFPSQLPFRAASAVGDRPLVVGLADGGLQVASLATGKLVAQTTLPRELEVNTEREISLFSGVQTHRLAVRPIVVVDDSRDRIVVFANRQAYAIGITPLKLPDEPVLAIAVDMPKSVVVDEQIEIAVKPSDPRAQVSLLSPPPGMRLADGRLVWKPTFAQVGTVKFALHIRHGEAILKQDFVVEVANHTALCPFRATHGRLDDKSTRLVIWSLGAPDEIGVIDLNTRETVATRKLPARIVAAAMAGETICVLTIFNNEAFLSLLDAKTLETKTQQTIKVESTLRYLDKSSIAMTDNSIAIHTPSGKVEYFSRPDLQKLSGEVPAAPASNAGPLLTDLPGFIRHAPPPERRDLSKSPLNRQAQVTFRARQLQSPAANQPKLVAALCDGIPYWVAVEAVAESIPGFTRIDLIAATIEGDHVVHRWPLEMFETAKQSSDVDVFWSVDGSKVVVLLGGRAFVRDLTALSTIDKSPFVLQPAKVPYLAKLDGKTRFSYSLTGGQPPYALGVKLPLAGGASQQSVAVIRVPGTVNQFDVDVASYVKGQFANIAATLSAWSQETASADAIIKAYVDSVAPQFERITGQKPTGIPIAFLVVVNARDAAGKTQELSHYVLADLRRETLEAELNVAIARRWPGTVIATDAQARVLALRGQTGSTPLIQFSKRFRHGVAPARPSSAELERSAQSALAKFEARWQQSLDKLRNADQRPLRKWIDQAGNEVTARFLQLFAGKVIVTLERGPVVTFDFEKLSETDQAYVREVTAPPDPNEQVARDARLVRVEQLRQIALAVHKFHDVYGMFPPPAFVDDNGHPVMSWRVMLLPFLGGEDLYRLFRLDEPWDSEHNRLLATYMPSIYRVTDVDTAPNATAIVRLTGPQTASPAGQTISFRDLTDGSSNTLLAAIVSKENAVVWTKPDNLAVDEQGDFSDQFWWHKDTALVVMCDAKVQSVSRNTSRAAWHSATTRNGGETSQLKTD